MSLMQKVCVGFVEGKYSSQSKQRQLKSVQKITIYIVFESCNYFFSLCNPPNKSSSITKSRINITDDPIWQINRKHSGSSQKMCENAASLGSRNQAGLLHLQTIQSCALENRALKIHVRAQRKYCLDDFGDSRGLPFYQSVVTAPGRTPSFPHQTTTDLHPWAAGGQVVCAGLLHGPFFAWRTIPACRDLWFRCIKYFRDVSLSTKCLEVGRKVTRGEMGLKHSKVTSSWPKKLCLWESNARFFPFHTIPSRHTSPFICIYPVFPRITRRSADRCVMHVKFLLQLSTPLPIFARGSFYHGTWIFECQKLLLWKAAIFRASLFFCRKKKIFKSCNAGVITLFLLLCQLILHLF